jgi:hypothetical protein
MSTYVILAMRRLSAALLYASFICDHHAPGRSRAGLSGRAKTNI